MDLALRLGFVLAAASAVAALYYVALRRSRAAARWALALLVFPQLALPLVLPADHRLARFLCALPCAALFARCHDLLSPRSPVPDARRFVAFLLNPTSLVLRRLDAEPTPSRAENLRRIARGLGLMAFGGGVLVAVTVGLPPLPFVLEHPIRALFGWTIAYGLVAVGVAVPRLFGLKMRDVFHNIFTARTPAEFWRRYNRTVNQYFHEDLWKPLGGARSPLRGTLLVFAASAVLHEYVFGIAIGAVQGFQTAFFLLQGLLVALTLRVRPRGLAAIPWTLGTAAFNLASSALFLASVHQIVPFWSKSPFTP